MAALAYGAFHREAEVNKGQTLICHWQTSLTAFYKEIHSECLRETVSFETMSSNLQ